MATLSPYSEIFATNANRSKRIAAAAWKLRGYGRQFWAETLLHSPYTIVNCNLMKRNGRIFLREENSRSARVVLYPKQEHFAAFLEMHAPKLGLFERAGPSFDHPGAIGVINYSKTGVGTWVINFVQGAFKLAPAETKAGDTKDTGKLFDRATFREHYADWRVSLFERAIRHARENNACLVFDLSKKRIAEHVREQLFKDFENACERAKVKLEGDQSTGKFVANPEKLSLKQRLERITSWPLTDEPKVRATMELFSKLKHATPSFTRVDGNTRVKRVDNLFLVVREPRDFAGFTASAYPQTEHLSSFLDVQSPNAQIIPTGHVAFPGSIGTIYYTPHNYGVNKNLHITAVCGNFRFLQRGKASASKGDLKTRLMIKKRFFHKNYGLWQVKLFKHVMEHALQDERTVIFDLDRTLSGRFEREWLMHLTLKGVETAFKTACREANMQFEKKGSELVARPRVTE